MTFEEQYAEHLRLAEKYPTLLPPSVLPFEVDAGWLSLIDRLCAAIMRKCGGWRVEAVQVKSKFGGLRFYISAHASEHAHDALAVSIDRVETLIDAAERVSWQTCEVCGEPGIRFTDTGWVQTLCDKHRSA